MRRCIARCLPCFAAPLLLLAAPASANTYTVGAASEFGCGYTTIQAAINAAAMHVGADTVLVSDTLTYTNQQLVVADSAPLSILGGYSTCLGRPNGGRAVLRGTGAQSVLRTAPGMAVDLTLSGLELRGGQATYGGGIDHMAAGRVTITYSAIRANAASFGGGIAMREPAGAVVGARELVLGDGVVIGDTDPGQSNRADLGGGGVYLSAGSMRMAGIGSSVISNSSNGDGGGVYVEGHGSTDVRADFGSGGDANLGMGVLSGNYASSGSGGGLYASGPRALVRIAATDPLRDADVSGNIASYGGAFALLDGADLRAWNVGVTGNLANGAGGVLVLRDAANAWFGADVALGGPPVGAIGCDARPVCGNRIVGNNGGQELGAVFAVIGNVATGSSSLTLESSVLRGNNGTTLIGNLCSPGVACTQFVLLRNCLIHANSFEHVLQTWDATYPNAWVDECTIAANPAGSGNGALFDGNHALHLSRSILWQPGRTMLHLVDGRLDQADHLLVHSNDGLPLSADVQVADPLFVKPADGNFRVRPGSPALDRAPAAGASTHALDGAMRVIDLPTVADGDGPLDLGAYELQELPDLIFKNGFEAAPSP